MAFCTLRQPRPKPPEDPGPPKLRVFRRLGEGAPFEDLLADAKKSGFAPAPSKSLSLASRDRGLMLRIKDALPCFCGTMAAYALPGKRLGKEIVVFDDEAQITCVFPVPVEYRREKDAILISEHPFYSIGRNGFERVICASKVDIITKFPRENGWYHIEETHGIPAGRRLKDVYPVHLYRTKERVGPITRGFIDEFSTHLGIGLTSSWTNRFGMIVKEKSIVFENYRSFRETND